MKNEEKPPNPLLMEESEQKLLKIIGQTMLPTESPGLRYQEVQIRDLEEEKESDDTEAVMKKQEESPDPLSMKELAMKLMAKEERGGFDTLSTEELEEGCGQEEDTRDPKATNLRTSSEETSATKRIGGGKENSNPAVGISVRASSVASQPTNHPLGIYSSREVAVETKGRIAPNLPTCAPTENRYEYKNCGA